MAALIFQNRCLIGRKKFPAYLRFFLFPRKQVYLRYIKKADNRDFSQIIGSASLRLAL
jgi:hypothetical protein